MVGIVVSMARCDCVCPSPCLLVEVFTWQCAYQQMCLSFIVHIISVSTYGCAYLSMCLQAKVPVLGCANISLSTYGCT